MIAINKEERSPQYPTEGDSDNTELATLFYLGHKLLPSLDLCQAVGESIGMALSRALLFIIPISE